MEKYIRESDAVQTVMEKPDMTPDEKAGIIRRLKAIPAADVVEVRHEPYMALSTVEVVAVRHGMWLRTPTGWVYCSVCGEEPPEETNARTKYCPNCGAVMDGGQDDGD